MIREKIANGLIGAGRSIGKLLGLQLAVELSDHSISIQMEQVDESKHAWDTSLYKHGNVFLKNYANPIKPKVVQNDGLENPNTAEVEESDTAGDREDVDDDSEEQSDSHVQLISSGRYRDYMRQDLISQLLTPESRWNKMLYGLIALAALQFLGIIITLYATGNFA